ncbi:hypothetical protein BDM02DRAFT_3124883, partial [Thelephora ganbajun]
MQLSHTDRINRTSSSVFNSIPPAGGDCSDLGNYRTKIITLRIRVLDSSGGLPACVLIVWTKRLER